MAMSGHWITMIYMATWSIHAPTELGSKIRQVWCDSYEETHLESDNTRKPTNKLHGIVLFLSRNIQIYLAVVACSWCLDIDIREQLLTLKVQSSIWKIWIWSMCLVTKIWSFKYWQLHTLNMSICRMWYDGCRSCFKSQTLFLVYRFELLIPKLNIL